MNDGRRVTMFDLDRHLSQALEQARHAPLSVQRYGQSWVWLLSSDAWIDAARWGALDAGTHPWLQLRQAVDPHLRGWPEPVLAALQVDGIGRREQQRAALLVAAYAPHTAQRLHDDLHHQQLYRRFIGLDAGSIVSLPACAALLQACRSVIVMATLIDAVTNVPAALLRVLCAPDSALLRAHAGSFPQQIEGSCLSY
ncbi:MAG: hypothetical protein GAK31_00151 [Stenotrophomonas maltophilia]|uniref:Transposase n=1 Tax=Stenotrophomonas maltophilia TaxID=40324 RepID=A0A7V8FJ01_STEMA|nr:MAG: hypothetical protein GAK31_00151 [Stenotrophomonas maltophilia]